MPFRIQEKLRASASFPLTKTRVAKSQRESKLIVGFDPKK
jgi:hypothetical protein